jgi:hypothetical protein
MHSYIKDGTDDMLDNTSRHFISGKVHMVMREWLGPHAQAQMFQNVTSVTTRTLGAIFASAQSTIFRWRWQRHHVHRRRRQHHRQRFWRRHDRDRRRFPSRRRLRRQISLRQRHLRLQKCLRRLARHLLRRVGGRTWRGQNEWCRQPETPPSPASAATQAISPVQKRTNMEYPNNSSTNGGGVTRAGGGFGAGDIASTSSISM